MVVVGNAGTTSTWVFENLGVGFGLVPAGAPATDAGAPVAAAVANMDNAGGQDLVILHDNDTITLHINGAVGTLATTATIGVPPASGVAQGMCLADVTGDGRQDIIIVYSDTGVGYPDAVRVLSRNGAGLWTVVVSIAAGDAKPIGPITARDLDHDGDIDIAVMSKMRGSIAIVVYFQNVNDPTGPFASLSRQVIPIIEGRDLTTTTAISPGSPSLMTTYLNGEVAIFEDATQPFLRGDANGDGSVNMGDAITILNVLGGSLVPGNWDACDVDDDGFVTQGDVQFLFNALFVPNSPAPPAPFVVPGFDPTEDNNTLSPTTISTADAARGYGFEPWLFPQWGPPRPGRAWADSPSSSNLWSVAPSSWTRVRGGGAGRRSSWFMAAGTAVRAKT